MQGPGAGVTTDEIHEAVAALVQAARTDGLPPVSVAVSDAHGDLLYFYRMPGAPRRTVRIALAKAYTAALWDLDTGSLKQRLQEAGNELAWFADPNFTALPGGVPVRRRGTLVCSIGVSGRRSHEDVALAQHALERLQAE